SEGVGRIGRTPANARTRASRRDEHNFAVATAGDATTSRPIPVSAVRYLFAKRLLDITLSSTVLLLGSPLYAVIALLVKLSSPGPIFFRQTRVGEGGRLFTCYKFRSMCADAEAKRAHLLYLNEVNGPVFKIKDDPRITRLGRVLRKLSLDELP